MMEQCLQGSGRKGDQMGKERKLVQMDKSMKGNGKMGNDLTGQSTINSGGEIGMFENGKWIKGKYLEEFISLR